MKIELTIKDIANLVKGIGPGSYDTMVLCSKYGYLDVDSWVWDDHTLLQATEEELFELYEKLKVTK